MKAHLIFAVAALLGLAVSVAIAVGGPPKAASDDNYVFSGKPVVDFEGRVTHAETGEGLVDTYVIVNMRSYQAVAYTHHGVSGCRESSQVVKTDAQGRYRVHWDWNNSESGVPDDLSVNVKAYKPNWAHSPRAAKTGSSFLVSMQRDFQMLPSEQPLSERLDTLNRLILDNCSTANQSPLGIEMSEAVYQEVWGGMCDTDAPISVGQASTAVGVLAGTYYEILRDRAPHLSEADLNRILTDRHLEQKALVPELRVSSGTETPEDRQMLSIDQKQSLCQFLTFDEQNAGSRQ